MRHAQKHMRKVFSVLCACFCLEFAFLWYGYCARDNLQMVAELLILGWLIVCSREDMRTHRLSWGMISGCLMLCLGYAMALGVIVGELWFLGQRIGEALIVLVGLLAFERVYERVTGVMGLGGADILVISGLALIEGVFGALLILGLACVGVCLWQGVRALGVRVRDIWCMGRTGRFSLDTVVAFIPFITASVWVYGVFA